MKNTAHKHIQRPRRHHSVKFASLSDRCGAAQDDHTGQEISAPTAGGVVIDEHSAAPDKQTTVTATIVERQPDPSYLDGLAALADALVLQMFDSGVGEALRMAYTMIQQHQERTNRRTQLSMATEALREHLARLDETLDDL